MKDETYTQFKKRVLADKSAFDFIMKEYFTSHPEYNEKTNKIEKVM